MQKKPQIGIYSGVVPSTTFIERLVNGLANHGFNVLHFGVKQAPTSYSKNVKVLGYYNNKLSKLATFIKYSLLLFLFRKADKGKLDKILKQNNRNNINSKLRAYPVLWAKPDILHIQWAKTIDQWMWVQKFDMRLILSLRGAHINYSPLANKKLAESYKQNFPKIDGFHAVSQAISLEAQKYNANPKRIKIVYSGLDSMILKPSETDFKKPLSIISVGRDHWKKGYSDAVDAMSFLKLNSVQFNYTIVGAAKSVELLYQIKDLKLESEVTLLPALPFEEVQKMIQKADLLLLSSVEEGIANVVLEAMSLGTLVLSTDCGGMAEVISDGVNGYIIPKREPKTMALKIESICNTDIDLLDNIRKNAWETIDRKHKIEDMVQGMSALYLETINNENNPR